MSKSYKKDTQKLKSDNKAIKVSYDEIWIKGQSKPLVVALAISFLLIGAYFVTPPALKTRAGGAGGGIAGDINGDGTVNIFDLSILLSNYGKTGPAPTPAG